MSDSYRPPGLSGTTHPAHGQTVRPAWCRWSSKAPLFLAAVLEVMAIVRPGTKPPSSPLAPPETSFGADDRALSLPERLHAYYNAPDRPVPFRHSGWINRRRRVQLALLAADTSAARYRRFATCGDGYWVLRHRHHPDRYKVALQVCHDRWCTPCNRAKAARVVANVRSRLDSPPYRHLTLTLRHRDVPLSQQLDRLLTSFAALRRSRLWRDRTIGGAAFIELKVSRIDHLWHPHLHAILEGDYMPRPQLTALWQAITHDSRHVDIGEVENTRKAVYYITKYLTKAVSPAVYNHPDRLAEAVKALAHRRLMLTFGTWRSWPLCAAPSDGNWQLYTNLDTVIINARLGDPHYRSILAGYTAADPDDPAGEFTARSPPFDPDRDLPSVLAALAA